MIGFLGEFFCSFLSFNPAAGELLAGVIAKSFAGLFLFADEVKLCSAFKLSKHIFRTSERCVALLCLCAKKIEVLFSMGMLYN